MTPSGYVFPILQRRGSGLAVSCTRFGGKKYRSEARMIFSQPTKPQGGSPCVGKSNPLPLLRKTEKYFHPNKKCRPYGLHSCPYHL